jgi:hypothetical protein
VLLWKEEGSEALDQGWRYWRVREGWRSGWSGCEVLTFKDAGDDCCGEDSVELRIGLADKAATELNLSSRGRRRRRMGLL